MFRLKTLGGALLEGPGGPETGAATQRRRLAVLSLLAASGSGISRDRLVAFLWPESDAERARHALSQLLYALRRDLGDEVVTGGSTALRLNAELISSDVRDFHDALARGALERAVALVDGPFLDGFHLSGCPEFERWVEGERTDIARKAEQAVETLALRAAESGDVLAAAHWWQRLATLLPYDSRVALELMKARVRAGDPAGALRHAQVHTALLRAELEAAPDPAVTELVAALTSASPPSEQPPEPAAARAAGGEEPAPAIRGEAEQPSEQLAAVASAGAAVAVRATRRSNRRALRLAVPAAVAAAIVMILLASLQAGGPRPGERDRVIIADVETGSGDAVLDHTVPVALAASLTQSSRVYAAAPERIRQALARMRMPGADSELDEALARRIAQREGLRVVVVPTIVRAGGSYELSARIIDPVTGGVLGMTTARAATRADVLDALDHLARGLRRDLGESLLSVATRSVPLPRVTTPSLDALEKYAAGSRAFGMHRLDEARKLWEGAVEIDPEFAIAHAALGMLEYWVNRQAAGDAHFEQALAHLDGLPERESVLIRARAFSWRGNRAASTALVRTWLAQNPEDLDLLRFLAYDYLRMRRAADAAAILTRIVARDSTDAASFINLATVEKQLGRYRDALGHYRRAFTLMPELETANDNVNLEYGSVYVLLGKPDSAAAIFTKLLAGDVNRRARGLRSLAFLSMFDGRYETASRNLSEAIPLNQRAGAAISEIRNRLLLAGAFEHIGRTADAVEQRDSAYAVSERTDVEPTMLFWLGKALARAGDAARAMLLLDRLEAKVHEGSTVDSAALEGLRGEVAVARGDAAAALSHLRRSLLADSTRYTLESLAHGTAEAGDLEQAARLYEGLGNGIEFGWEAQDYARTAPYWLGRIEESRGRPGPAARAYARFLGQGRDADPALVLARDARTRLAQLRVEEDAR